MTLEDRIVERAAQLIADRLMGDSTPSNRAKDKKPLVDGDGDLRCPEHPDKAFISETAYKWHRSRVHKDKGGSP